MSPELMAGGPESRKTGFIDKLIPPGGYSFGGAAESIGQGCVGTALAFMGVAGFAAPFTDGASIPAAAAAGCVNGAVGGFVIYMLKGDAQWPDTSIMDDVRSDLHTKLR